MAKRFTDSEKFKKKFVRSLEAPYKLLWFYLLDDCDHAGIWHIDMEIASIRIGEKVEYEKAIKLFGKKVVEFDDKEKWFIPSFIEFQYGQLNENNRAHNNVLRVLRKYKLINEKMVLKSPLKGAKEKEQSKDEEQLKEKTNYDIFLEMVSEFQGKYTKQILNEFFSYWSEPSKSGKLRWEMEKTWDTNRRLKRWVANSTKKPEGRKYFDSKEPLITGQEQIGKKI